MAKSKKEKQNTKAKNGKGTTAEDLQARVNGYDFKTTDMPMPRYSGSRSPNIVYAKPYKQVEALGENSKGILFLTKEHGQAFIAIRNALQKAYKDEGRRYSIKVVDDKYSGIWRVANDKKAKRKYNKKVQNLHPSIKG